jgi:long-subunit fatty acid transport protein
MKKNGFLRLIKTVLIIVLWFAWDTSFSQEVNPEKQKSVFWKNVQFGGGLGLGFGSGYTDITIAPTAIYNFNDYFALGAGVQYSYLRQKDFFKSSNYGASVIGLFNPIPEAQLSVELEQLRVNLTYEDIDVNENFWNTALFLGAGYRMENVTIGARYNVLFDKDKNVYGEAFMPFVRVFF